MRPEALGVCLHLRPALPHTWDHAESTTACRPLSFEEFKGFYNCAIDDCAGKKPKPPKAKRSSSTVEPEVEAARLKVAEERARKQAEESERIRRENVDIKTKVAAASKGKDAKAVEAEVQAARRAAMGERARGRAGDKARIAVGNQAMKEDIKSARAQEGAAAREAVTDPEAAEQPAEFVDSTEYAEPEVQAGEASPTGEHEKAADMAPEILVRHAPPEVDHGHNDDQVGGDG